MRHKALRIRDMYEPFCGKQEKFEGSVTVFLPKTSLAANSACANE
jgi:hypothetical protein